MKHLTVQRQDILDRIGAGWSAREIRDLASSLCRLADSLEQEWDGSNIKSVFTWPNALRRIERNSLNLAIKAQQIYSKRLERRQHVPAELLSEPAWDMLLELFMQFAGGAKVSVTSLCLASNVPMTTALRHVRLLEEAGLVARSASQVDKRVTLVGLTDKGILSMGRFLEEY